MQSHTALHCTALRSMNRNATSSLPCPTTRHHYASRALTDQRLPQVGGGGGVVGVPLQVLLQPEQEAVLQRYSGGRRASVEEAGGGVGGRTLEVCSLAGLMAPLIEGAGQQLK